MGICAHGAACYCEVVIQVDTSQWVEGLRVSVELVGQLAAEAAEAAGRALGHLKQGLGSQ
jgi:hypothetical protein